MTEIYNSTTHGPIPLSFNGRRLMQNLRFAIQSAVRRGEWEDPRHEVSHARGELALYISHLEKLQQKRLRYSRIPDDQVGSARRSREPWDSYDLPGRIVIDVNPHGSQRYDTVGDYQVVEGGFVNAREKVLWITVSKLADRRESLLIAIHELIEAALCATAGVDFAKIDDFDFHQGWPDEPGDHIQAPYYRQHQIATGIERLLAAEMKVDWLEYETHCKELSHDTSK